MNNNFDGIEIEGFEIDGIEIDGIISNEIDLITNWFQSQIRRNNTSDDVFEVKREEEDEHLYDIECSFSKPSLVRLLRAVGITQSYDSCFPILRQLIYSELHRVLNIAMIFKDDRNTKVLKQQDVINAIGINHTIITSDCLFRH